MQKYERGDTIRVTATFTNPDNGALVDPTSPTCEVYTPDGTQKLSGAMNYVSQGIYRAECQTDFDSDLGYWEVRVYATYDSKQVANVDKIQIVEVI